MAIKPQIGDWFTFYDALDSKVRKWEVSDYANYFNMNIEGVVLSRYLLSCNGFKPYGRGHSVLSQNGVCVIVANDIMVVSIEGKARSILPMPYYVHEYQQALRVCGLSELADSFEVKDKSPMI